MDIVHIVYIVYIIKCRYEIQEQKEISVWCTGIYLPILSTGYLQSIKYTSRSSGMPITFYQD
jgi:hypothetical protein